MRAHRHLVALGLLLGTVIGCADGRSGLLPNSDKNLRKPTTEFAADAVKRHPYKADAPHGGEAVAAAEVGYVINRVSVVNLSDEPWTDVEVWINRNWVVYLPTMEPKVLKQLDFRILYDDGGRHFPLNNHKLVVNDVSILRDGKMYSVPLQLAD